MDGLPVAIKEIEDHSAFQRESLGLKLASRQGISVPQYLWHGTLNNRNLLVMEWQEGKLLNDLYPTAIPMRVISSIATVIGQLHSSTFGLEDEASRILACIDRNYRSNQLKRTLDRQLAKWIQRLSSSTVLAMGGYKELEVTASSIQENDPKALSILHCDLTLRNFLQRPDGTVVLIDFGTVLYGDPLFDLAKIIWLDLGGTMSDESSFLLQTWEATTQQVLDSSGLNPFIRLHCIAAASWVDKQVGSTKDSQEYRERAIVTFLQTKDPT